MKRLLTTAMMAMVLLGTAACSDTGNKTAGLQTMQVSSIHWDEMASATTAAHVSNNGLIMMR